MIIFGAFTLLIAAPSFAQEKVQESSKNVEKVEVQKEREVKKMQERRVEPENMQLEKKSVRQVESVENRKLKAVPLKEGENK